MVIFDSLRRCGKGTEVPVRRFRQGAPFKALQGKAITLYRVVEAIRQPAEGHPRTAKRDGPPGDFSRLTGRFGQLFQYHAQKCHSDAKAVLCLAKVGGPRIAVDFHGDLVEARERMHDDGVGFH